MMSRFSSTSEMAFSSLCVLISILLMMLLSPCTCIERCPAYTTGLGCYCQKYYIRLNVPDDKSCENCYLKLPVECINKGGGCWSFRGGCESSCGTFYQLKGANICTKTCPRDYYEDLELLQTCSPCHDSCNGCNGPSDTHCNSCRFALMNDTCVSKCPPNYILYKGKYNKCIKLDQCTGYITDSKCMDLCPTGYYPSNATLPGRCLRCSPVCKTCTGQGPDKCLECSKFWYGKRCVQSCPFNAPFISNGTCSKKCLAGSCQTLCGRKYLWNGTCVASCPEHHKFVQNGTCVKECSRLHRNNVCVTNCPQRTFEIGTSCEDHCPAGKFMDGHICVEHCPLFSYGKVCKDKCPGRLPSVGGKCVFRCPSTLRYIDPKTQECTKHCRFILFKGKCVETCPKGYFKSSNSCSKCSDMCVECYGPGTSKCKSCRFYNSSNICVKNCPAGTVIERDSKDCLAKCPGHSVHVDGDQICQMSCPDTAQYILEDRCLEQCPPDQNATYNKHCMAECPPKMTKKTDGTCYKCPLVLENGRCVSQCPFGTAFSGKTVTTNDVTYRMCVANSRFVLVFGSATVITAIPMAIYVCFCSSKQKPDEENEVTVV